MFLAVTNYVHAIKQSVKQDIGFAGIIVDARKVIFQ